ncbi:helix-turn-helix domain-containing protein [Bradyrhizobium sediminis]|uniref:Helix-turn-helix domain-containing protein n=1 Tax=Bradyrhizobium sediminis TaxID=2840469 RepID=A0A975NPE0_9BRAD|nr:helix-turn-helix domain-containing protein [Bradyrhizobium sediminis]QWG18231.1 helix-turn-helix domain-containing protein [Bradyrhizobium sediminis]
MSATPASRTVQTYNLFGESGDLPDVVHCETIAARSVLHEWEFAPHRHPRLHQILLIERGGGQATLEGRIHPLRPMRIVNVPTGDVHGFSFKPGTQGWVLTVSAEMLDEVLTPSEGLRRVLAHSTVVRGTPEMRSAMQQIFAEFAGRHFARAHLLRALSAALIGLVAREMAANGRMPGGMTKPDLFRRFEALLDQHFLQHWTVSDYAAALSITPTHLSRLTRSATGHAASHLILDRVIREARRNLVYTNLPVSTIAYALGFSDPAYFSRLFSGATGLSPRGFRDKVHKGD